VENNTQVTNGTILNTKFGKLALECTACTPTEKNDGFILTLKHKDHVEANTPFGKKVVDKQLTFFMKVAEECKVGFKADMDIDSFIVKERPFDTTDTTVGNDGIIMLKWLHLN
jgi:hypothetical protein